MKRRSVSRISIRRISHFPQSGWTLAELLIVIVIISILAVMFLMVNWKRSIFRAQDARRKSDIASVRRAFEEYYNDNGCYPSMNVLDSCGSETSDIKAYLRKIPCDPTTKEPYKYQPDSETNMCLGNRVCAKLQDWADPDITTLGCHAEQGCGWGAFWNYCLATGTTVTAPGFNPLVTATPSPSPTPSYSGPYACRPGSYAGGVAVSSATCNNVGTPASYDCPMSWAESDCQGYCTLDTTYWCGR